MASASSIRFRVLASLLLAFRLCIHPASGQEINRIEYFFDTDPGQGMAMPVPFTPDSVISNLTFSPDITALTPGFHNLCIRAEDENMKWSFTALRPFYREALPAVLPDITRVEYFIDNDPGTGSGIPVAITPGTNLSGLVFPVALSSVTTGFHTLVIRSQDASLRWSLTAIRSFFRESAPAVIPVISRVEYYIDQDPGPGLGHAVPFTPGTNVTNILFTPNTDTLVPGFHTLVVRALDVSGKWSQVALRSFYREPVQLPPSPVTEAEYFIDTDPGQGAATKILLTPGTNITNLIFPVDISALTTGFHNLCIRSKDAAGKWSELALRYFYKDILPVPSLSPVTRAEYYIDTDPGCGLGTAIPVTPSVNITNLPFLIDAGPMAFGRHTVSVRTMDANGHWSLSAQLEVKKYRVRAMLEGLYAGNGLMNQAMDENGPHYGADTADLVTVELHSGGNYTSVAEEYVNIPVKTNGDIAFPAGPDLMTGSYYITVKHRNSIETTTATAVSIASGGDSYDFTTAAGKAYGSNQKNMGGVYAFWGGDVNQDGIVDGGDMNPVDNASTAITFGYFAADTNGDGIVDLSDMNIVDNNATALITAERP